MRGQPGPGQTPKPALYVRPFESVRMLQVGAQPRGATQRRPHLASAKACDATHPDRFARSGTAHRTLKRRWTLSADHNASLTKQGGHQQDGARRTPRPGWCRRGRHRSLAPAIPPLGLVSRASWWQEHLRDAMASHAPPIQCRDPVSVHSPDVVRQEGPAFALVLLDD